MRVVINTHLFQQVVCQEMDCCFMTGRHAMSNCFLENMASCVACVEEQPLSSPLQLFMEQLIWFKMSPV